MLEYYLETEVAGSKMLVQFDGSKALSGRFIIKYTAKKEFAISFDNAELAKEFASNINNPFEREFEIVAYEKINKLTVTPNYDELE